MNDELATDDAISDAVFEKSVGRKAAKRSWLSAGAGFAMMGRPGAAVTLFALTISLAPVFAWLAWHPSAVSAWTFLSISLLVLALALFEQCVIRFAELRTPAPRFMVERVAITACAGVFSLICAIVVLYTSFGTLRMVGPGMSPILKVDEIYIYSKRPDVAPLQPGSVIAFNNSSQSAWGEPGWLIVSLVLAVPGDRLGIEDGNYVVNGASCWPVGDTGDFAPVIEIPAAPESITTPDFSYFVVQNNPSDAYDSRVLSWVKSRDIVATRLWYLRRDNLFGEIKPASIK